MANEIQGEIRVDFEKMSVERMVGGEEDDPEPVPEEVTDRARATASLSGASSDGDSDVQQSGETIDVSRRLKDEMNAGLIVFEKKDGRRTVEVPQVKCVDEIIRAPVVARCSEENGLDEVSDLVCGRGDRSVSRKDSRPRFMCGDFGVSVVGKVQGVGGREPGIEVEQGSSPGPAGDPRSPKAKQIWVRWEGRSRAVDLSRHMREEIKDWLGVETEEGLYLICGGRRVQWDNLEEVQEERVIEVMAEIRGGMGNKKKVKKGKNSSGDENPWVTPDETEPSEPEKVGSWDLLAETLRVSVREEWELVV